MTRHRIWSTNGVRFVCVALVIAAFIASDPAALAEATLVNIATDVTDPFDLADTEPSIAVNPTDPMKIAVVAFSGNWGPGTMAPVWKSDDGGATWRKVLQIPQPAPNIDGPGDQKIAFDQSGKLYIAELGVIGTTNKRQNFIYRQAGSPDDPLTPGEIYGDDQPHLEVDAISSGTCLHRVYSPWLKIGSPNQSMITTSVTGGNEVKPDVSVGDASSFPNRTTRIALAHDGKAYAVYKTMEGPVAVSLPGSTAPSDFQKVHFYVRRSDDCGETWDGLGKTGVSIHGLGTVESLFTTNFGNRAKGKVGRARSSDAWIAVANNGDVYVAYLRRDASGFSQVYVARSIDQGLTWVSHPVTSGTHHSAYPEIAVAANGMVGVLYIDFDDSGSVTLFRHRFSRSGDKGQNWTDDILQSMDPGPLTNAASGFLWGDYEGLTAFGNTFYGVFTGRSMGRTVPQLDPIFFKIGAQ